MRLTTSVALVASGEVRLSDQYDCNAYLVDAPDGPVLVDTGGGRDTERILRNCREAFGDPVAAVLTHAHADHSQGAPALQDRGVRVIAPSPSDPLLTGGTDRELGLTAARNDGVYPSDYEFTHFEPNQTVDPGTTIVVAGLELEVVGFRGHSLDHVCYLADLDGRRVCFVGDAVASDGEISLLNVSGSSLAEYREDVEKFAGRDVDALFPGHGLPRLEDGQEAIEIATEALSGMFTPDSRT